MAAAFRAGRLTVDSHNIKFLMIDKVLQGRGSKIGCAHKCNAKFFRLASHTHISLKRLLAFIHFNDALDHHIALQL